MTDEQILLEYRFIRAVEYEDKTGKPYSDGDVVIDEEYADWQKSIGVDRDAIRKQGTVI